MEQGSKYEPEPIEDDDIGYEDSDSQTFIKRHLKKIIIIGVALAIIAGIIIYLVQPSNPESEPVEEYVPEPFKYSEEEVAALREWGYTGDEIERFQSDEASAYDKVIEAKTSQELKLRETYVELTEQARKFDTPEYKAIIEDSFLSLPKNDFKIGNVYEEGYERNTETTNVNYRKIKLRGNQTFIKLEFPDSSDFFMEVPPVRYFELDEVGNIVVQYEVLKIPAENGTYGVFYTKFEEVRF